MQQLSCSTHLKNEPGHERTKDKVQVKKTTHEIILTPCPPIDTLI